MTFQLPSQSTAIALSIRELPPSERPRERLVALGASALSSVELLALLVGAGSSGGSALQVGQALLAKRPLYAGLDRIPDSLVDASGDLGGRPWTTFRRVILPMAFPAVVAGSIFTFSLTLGDYITPLLAGGSSSQFIGNVVYDSVGVSNNVPFAAAFAAVPLVVMGVYLLIARRLGAFEAM